VFVTRGKRRVRGVCRRCEARAAAIRSGSLEHRAEYTSWRKMRERCRNPNARGFKNYGGRGVVVCARWDSFDLFLADLGPRPSASHSLDRRDPNGNYEPANCRWATRADQATNMRSNRILELRGVCRTATEWSRLLGIKRTTIIMRLKAGWSVERALS
jgi:hypothetical protein